MTGAEAKTTICARIEVADCDGVAAEIERSEIQFVEDVEEIGSQSSDWSGKPVSCLDKREYFIEDFDPPPKLLYQAYTKMKLIAKFAASQPAVFAE